MDLLYFDLYYSIVVCRRCQCAIVPKEIPAHLRVFHKVAEGLTNAEIRQSAKSFLAKPFHLPESTQQRQLPPNTPPIASLAVYHDGFSCRLCPAARPYVCRSETGLAHHLKAVHQWSRPRGRQSAAQQASYGLAQVALFPIAC